MDEKVVRINKDTHTQLKKRANDLGMKLSKLITNILNDYLVAVKCKVNK